MTGSQYEELRLGDLVSRLESGVSVRADDAPPAAGEVGVLKVSCLTGGRFDATESKRVPIDRISNLASPVRKGRVIISRSNTPELVGLCAYVSVDHPNLFLPDTLWQMEFSEERESDPRWLAYLLSSPAYREQLSRNASGTSANMKKLQKSSLLRMKIRVPPLPEQRKIAEILRTWDEAIEKLEKLRVAKQQKLSSLRQKLFGLNGQFRSEWRLRPLSELSTRIQRRNCGNNYPVMTISAKSGFLLQSDKYSRDMAGRSLENYIVLREGEFAYNKGNSLTYPQGCIFPLERLAALVPHVYFCFTLKEGLNRNFYAHLFEAGMLNRQLTRLINSGVRNDGLLNINAADFFSCRLPMPNLETQQTIATALTTAREELALLDSELEALTRQKRGLMQKLLTGEWRVSA